MCLYFLDVRVGVPLTRNNVNFQGNIVDFTSVIAQIKILSSWNWFEKR